MRRQRSFGFSPQEHERQHERMLLDVDQICRDVDDHLRRGECYDALVRMTYAAEFLGRATAHQRAGNYSTEAQIAARRGRLEDLRNRIVECFAVNCSAGRRLHGRR